MVAFPLRVHNAIGRPGRYHVTAGTSRSARGRSEDRAKAATVVPTRSRSEGARVATDPLTGLQTRARCSIIGEMSKAAAIAERAIS
jgi:hypothetical protein